MGALVLLSAMSWASAENLVRTNLRYGEWEVPINDGMLKVTFECRGTPGEEAGRANQFALFHTKNGQQKRIGSVEALLTEQISMREQWVFPLKSTSGKDYLLFILDLDSDGEDPTTKPLVLITDGQTLQMKKFELNEKYQGAIHRIISQLFSQFSKAGMDDETKATLRRIKN
jgi:hypothetical protein